jgi:hypothetical protein
VSRLAADTVVQYASVPGGMCRYLEQLGGMFCDMRGRHKNAFVLCDDTSYWRREGMPRRLDPVADMQHCAVRRAL